jgi:hypothetical protein
MTGTKIHTPSTLQKVAFLTDAVCVSENEQEELLACLTNRQTNKIRSENITLHEITFTMLAADGRGYHSQNMRQRL